MDHVAVMVPCTKTCTKVCLIWLHKRSSSVLPSSLLSKGLFARHDWRVRFLPQMYTVHSHEPSNSIATFANQWQKGIVFTAKIAYARAEIVHNNGIAQMYLEVHGDCDVWSFIWSPICGDKLGWHCDYSMWLYHIFGGIKITSLAWSSPPQTSSIQWKLTSRIT